MNPSHTDDESNMVLLRGRRNTPDVLARNERTAPHTCRRESAQSTSIADLFYFDVSDRFGLHEPRPFLLSSA